MRRAIVTGVVCTLSLLSGASLASTNEGVQCTGLFNRMTGTENKINVQATGTCSGSARYKWTVKIRIFKFTNGEAVLKAQKLTKGTSANLNAKLSVGCTRINRRKFVSWSSRSDFTVDFYNRNGLKITKNINSTIVSSISSSCK